MDGRTGLCWVVHLPVCWLFNVGPWPCRCWSALFSVALRMGSAAVLWAGAGPVGWLGRAGAGRWCGWRRGLRGAGAGVGVGGPWVVGSAKARRTTHRQPNQSLSSRSPTHLSAAQHRPAATPPPANTAPRGPPDEASRDAPNGDRPRETTRPHRDQPPAQPATQPARNRDRCQHRRPPGHQTAQWRRR